MNALRIILCLLPLSLLSSCQALVSGALDASGTDVSRVGACQNGAGAYALPLSRLKFEVVLQEASETSPAAYAIEGLTTVPSSDPRQIYCLDFLYSAFANDKISIGRSGGLLLDSISSEFADQTAEIANKVIDAAAQAVAAAGPRGSFITESGEAKTKTYTAAQFDFDPFVREDMVSVNRALAPLDHCVFLDPSNDPYVPAWQGQMCTGYEQVGSDYPYYGIPVITREPPPVAAAARGVLYRPLLTHKLVIMKRNHEPIGPAWQLFQTKRISMPNAAPTFVLEVNRSALVDRKMSISFQSGVLNSIRIEKPSEIDAVANLLLRTVQVIVTIPVRALVIGQTEAKNRQQLINAQAALIQTLRQYGRDVQDYTAQTVNPPASNSQQPGGATPAPVTQGDYNAKVADCMQNGALIAGDPLAYCTNKVASETTAAAPGTP